MNIIDEVTRFQHLIPIRNVDSQSALEAWIKYFGLFGVPNYILTDNGTQYVNQAITYLQEKVGCKQITTTPYNKEQNAVVERK